MHLSSDNEQGRQSAIAHSHLKSANINAGHGNDLDRVNVSNSNETNTSNTNDYQYSEGINFKLDLPEHLTTVDDFTQKKGVTRAHTLGSFDRAVKEYYLRITSKVEHPTVKGVYEIRYEIPLKNKQLEYTGDYKEIKEPKTVYDPSIISDDKIIEWGQQAADRGLNRAIANNDRRIEVTVKELTFRVYIDLNTKTVINFLTIILKENDI